MAVLTRDEFFAKIHDKFGDDTSDESIQFLEDLTDTYNSLDEKAAGDGEDWKAKYQTLNETWKKKYQRRFFSGNGRSNFEEEEESSAEDKELEKATTITINDLFGGNK